MWIAVNSTNSSLLPRLATPESGIGDEKQLFLGEKVQTREHGPWRNLFMLLPSLKCGF